MRRSLTVGLLAVTLAIRAGGALAQAAPPPSADPAPPAEPAPAAAPDTDEALYRRTVADAVAEYDRGNWAEARALFLRAHELSPSARTWRTLGMTAFEQKDYVSALRELSAALSDERRPLDAPLRAEVESVRGRTRAFVGRYRVVLDPTDAALFVDDKPATLEADGALLLGLGTHHVRAEAPGRRTATRALEVQGRDDAAIELRLEPETAPAVLASPSPTSMPAHTDADAGGTRLWTWVAAAGAVAFGGAAVGLWLAAGSEHDDLENACADMPSGMCVEGDPMLDVDDSTLTTLETLTTVSLVAAGVSAAAAVTLFFVEGDDGTSVGADVGAGHARLHMRF